jgi:hypothetical protein
MKNCGVSSFSKVLFIDDDSRNTLSAEKHGVQTLLILLKD